MFNSVSIQVMRRICGYAGVRIGKANNPRPLFKGRTVNITSLTPHLSYVASFDLDFLSLQEVRLAIDGQKIINKSPRAYWMEGSQER